MGYGLHMWNPNGRPTVALSAFLNSLPPQELVNNPGPGARTVALALARDETVQLSLFSLTGQLLRVVCAPHLLRSVHTVACETAGLAPGIYVLKIRHGDQVATQKLVQR